MSQRVRIIEVRLYPCPLAWIQRQRLGARAVDHFELVDERCLIKHMEHRQNRVFSFILTVSQSNRGKAITYELTQCFKSISRDK